MSVVDPTREDVLITGTASHLQQGLKALSQLEILCLHQQPPRTME